MDIIGCHQGAAIESMTLGPDGKTIACCSHDSVVKFWDVQPALDRARKVGKKKSTVDGEEKEGAAEEDEEEQTSKKQKKRKKGGKMMMQNVRAMGGGFFDDL